MSAETETPSQRQARIRQQKREAKIKGAAQERLDKITQLSGRAPETMSTSAPVAPGPSQSHTPNARSQIDNTTPAANWMSTQANDPDQARLQEEYMRVLLGGAQPGQAQQPGQSVEEDPMMKMMQTMLGGMSGDPNAPATGGMPFSADDISKMTGMPSFLTSMFLGGTPQAPPTQKQLSSDRVWKTIRTVLVVLIGFYTVFTVDNSLSTFGQHPPAPATVQNPFVVFLMGQLLVNGAKITLSSGPGTQSGLKSYFQTGKDIAADGAIIVFMLGLYTWWNGLV